MDGSADGAATATAVAEPENNLLPPGSLSELAATHGLKKTAIRPPLRSYASELWQRQIGRASCWERV